MSTKVKVAKKPAVKKTEKTVMTKKSEVNVNGAELKKAIDARIAPKVETRSRFHIWDVYGVKYLMDDNMVPTRRVSVIEVTSDHDTANEPDLRNALIDDAEKQLIDQGFFMTDVDAMEDALRRVEPNLDMIRHDVKYGRACQKCVSERIGTALDWLEYLRNWRNRRFALADELGGTCNLPPVIPNDYEENWHVDGDKLVPNVKKPKNIQEIKITGATAEEMRKALAEANPKIELPKEITEKILSSISEFMGDKDKKLPPAQPTKQIAKK